MLDRARQIVSMLLFAAYGFVTGAMVAGIPTFYVYFLGAWLGAPVGAIWAGVVGQRMPLRDACLLFFGALSGLHIAWWLVNHSSYFHGPGWDGFGIYFVAWPGFALGGALLYVCSRQFLPLSTRRDIALPLVVFWLVYFATYVYRWLYVWE
ncbi:MAG TPA: hypothetical protein VF600_06570 [Abditibacteriaceae bacterium]